MTASRLGFGMLAVAVGAVLGTVVRATGQTVWLWFMLLVSAGAVGFIQQTLP